MIVQKKCVRVVKEKKKIFFVKNVLTKDAKIVTTTVSVNHSKGFDINKIQKIKKKENTGKRKNDNNDNNNNKKKKW